MELLPDDVVELILHRLPVKILLSFKSVSKKWKSTIESRRFQEEQLIFRRKSRDPDVLFMCLKYHGSNGMDTVTDPQRFVVGSSVAHTIKLPVSGSMFSHGSCDGLVCLYTVDKPIVLVNPATGWHRSLPFSTSHQLVLDRFSQGSGVYPHPTIGFGKDKFNGTYKLVWMYQQDNSCEIFDFNINAWRNIVVPASLFYYKPVHLDGSIYWLNECEEEFLVLSLHLHTETFQVVCKAPFSHLCHPRAINICILDNRLCVSEKIWPIQIIWSFDCGSKTWNKWCSLDLSKTFSSLRDYALMPVALVDNNKLLLESFSGEVVLYDLHTKSFNLLFNTTKPIGSVYYFQSLLSV